MSPRDLPVVVIGAGPVGLASAVHLLDRKIDVIVLEASEEVGASQRDWGHVRLFSPWRYDVDKAAVRHLEASGWTPPPPEGMPTGADLYHRYLHPLAELPELSKRIRVNRRVTAITRAGVDKTRTDARSEVPFQTRSAPRAYSHAVKPPSRTASTTGSRTCSAGTAAGTSARRRWSLAPARR